MVEISNSIKACLFDMDGLLINTEDIYTIALNKILAKYGRAPVDWDFKMQIQGMPGPQAGPKILKHFDLPISFEEFNRMNVEYQNKLWATCDFMPGVLDFLKYLKAKKVPIALCTSSNKIKFAAKTSHLKELFSLFDTIITGDDPRIPVGRGKPFPDIWQLGLKELNEASGTSIVPDQCLVFEDGAIGATAGIEFGAFVVWIPHPEAHSVIGDSNSVLKGNGILLKSMEDVNKTELGI